MRSFKSFPGLNVALLVAFLAGFSGGNANATVCRDLFAGGIINENARTQAHQYSRPHARDLENYSRFLGLTFENFLARAQSGSRWVDVGGGYGIAGLQGAIRRKFKVSVINAQDFWSYFADGPLMPDRTAKFAEDLGINLSDIPIERKTVATVGMNLPYLDWAKVSRDLLEVVRTRILKRYAQTKSAGFFDYLVGFAENIFPTLREKADLITDLYGAFFYSSERALLLDLYYQNLSPNGVALIRFQTAKDRLGVADVVTLKSGERQSLIDYLTSKFPQVFSTDPGDPAVLVMKRNTALPDLRLQSLIHSTDVQMVYISGLDLPLVNWSER